MRLIKKKKKKSNERDCIEKRGDWEEEREEEEWEKDNHDSNAE